MPTTRSSSRSSSDKAPVEAIPDIVSHTDPNQPDNLIVNDDTGIEVIDKVESSAEMDQVPPEDISGRDQALAGSSKPEHITPEIIAIPLPMVDDGEDERWFKYKMSWSGKIYDIEVGANDLYVNL
jgi:hypothetical protein